jgi:tyrosyl-tRNA synthetase
MKFDSVEKQLALIRRGVEEIIPEVELIQKLEQSIKNEQPLIVKLGCDPSYPDLHIGHAVVLRKMRHFQNLGHQAVLVIGDFTGMIGDPSGRNKTRPQLTLEETHKNAESYLDQAKKILDMNMLKSLYNSTWLDSMSFSDIIRLTSKYTVARMLERDDFTKRYKLEMPISIHEFLYPLAQGMDSVHLHADVELGGTDQKFNLLVGRDLQREHGQNPQVIVTTPLLEGIDGSDKMSKSQDNQIGLNDPPEQMYGKIMSISDELLERYYLLGADSDSKTMEIIKRDLSDPKNNPRDLKRKLARRLVSMYHNDSDAIEAEAHFDKIHIHKGIPDEIESYYKDENETILDSLCETATVSSRSEGKRLMKQNAIKWIGELVTDPLFKPKPGFKEGVVKVGKRRFLKIIEK